MERGKMCDPCIGDLLAVTNVEVLQPMEHCNLEKCWVNRRQPNREGSQIH